MAWSFRQGHPRLVAIVSAVLVLAASFVFASAKLAGTAMAATPTMSTTASTNTEVGFQLFDNANLRNGDNPTGTIRFDLYGPDDATCATSIFNSIVTVTGNGSYNSASFITSQAGTYQWRAAYSGDANNTAITSACNEPSEQTIVTKALTVLSTTASGPIAIGGTITDTAHLSGGFNPTGTITFDLTGPNDVFCTGAVAFTSTVTVNGNGDYVSGPFAPTATGTYQWRARYSGDDNNLGEGPTGCIDPAESVIVVGGLVTPTLTTTASASVEAGGTVRDTAVLGGGALPTGTIGFQLYGPNDATCSGTPISTPPVPVNGNGTYVSPDITVNTPGTYRFVASYSGDIANNPVATACNDPAESVVVTPGTGSTTTSSSTSSTVPTTSSSTSSTVPTTSSSTSSTVPTTSSSTSSTVPGSSTSSSSTVPGSSTSSSSTVPGSSTSSSSTVPGSSTSSSSTVPGSSTSSSSTAPSSTSSTSSTSTSSTSTTSSSVPTGTTTSSSSSSSTSSTSSTVPTTPTTVGPTVPPGQPTIDVTPRTVVAGQDATVFGSGFPPSTPVDIVLLSSPVLLGTVVTDASGSFTTTVTIPSDTEPGIHRLVGAVRGGGPSAETTITVLAPAGSPLRPQGQLSRTGSDPAGSTKVAATLVVIGLLLVGGAGVGGFHGNGRRRRSGVQQPPTA